MATTWLDIGPYHLPVISERNVQKVISCCSKRKGLEVYNFDKAMPT